MLIRKQRQTYEFIGVIHHFQSNAIIFNPTQAEEGFDGPLEVTCS